MIYSSGTLDVKSLIRGTCGWCALKDSISRPRGLLNHELCIELSSNTHPFKFQPTNFNARAYTSRTKTKLRARDRTNNYARRRKEWEDARTTTTYNTREWIHLIYGRLKASLLNERYHDWKSARDGNNTVCATLRLADVCASPGLMENAHLQRERRGTSEESMKLAGSCCWQTPICRRRNLFAAFSSLHVHIGVAQERLILS